MFNSNHYGYPLTSGTCRVETVRTEKNGTHTLVREDAAKPLPPVETTDLGKILEDGTIPLQRVSSVIFSSHPENYEQPNEPEQTNETEQINDKEND